MNALPIQPQSTIGWLPQAVRVAEVVAEIPNVWTLRLAHEAEAPPEFSPGQFNMVYLPGFGEAAISISSGVHELPLLDHTVRAVGDVTRAMSRLRPGDELGLRGPFGRPWPLTDLLGKDILIVSGGIGLAPLRPAIAYLLRHRSQFGHLKLIYGAKSPGDLLFQREFPAWGDAGLEIETTVDRGTAGWKGHIGVVTELMRPLQQVPGQTSVLMCGPEIMMRFVAREGIRLGVDPSDIYVSMERNMKCAMGMCGVCQLGPEFICKDGPVFSYRRIAPFMNLEDL